MKNRAKKPRALAVFKRDGGCHFYLFAERLVQDSSDKNKFGWFREVKRSDLARVFKMDPNGSGEFIGSRAMLIDGRYSDEGWRRNLWRVFVDADYSTGRMNIGCQSFSREETARIQRWALRKRRTK